MDGPEGFVLIPQTLYKTLIGEKQLDILPDKIQVSTQKVKKRTIQTIKKKSEKTNNKNAKSENWRDFKC